MMVDEPKIEPPLPESKIPEPGPVELTDPSRQAGEAEARASEHGEWETLDLGNAGRQEDEAEADVRASQHRERWPLDLADLSRQVDEAEAEARAAEHRALQLQAEARGARERARLLRRQIQDEERRARRFETMSSSGSLGRTLSGGMLAGAGAGSTFALFIMLMDAVYGDDLFDWLHYSAAIALGRSVLQNDSLGVLLVGLFVHLALAGVYGAAFAAAARYIRFLRSHLITATATFGLGLWMVNFYFFSPLLFPWFRDNIFVVQFVAHTLFFGVPLGIILMEFTPTGGIMGRNQAMS
ncbi:MAG: hypothetical protein J2P45_04625 [Candidatus Dormibacteraeota bacterium]|nr:hypothetical protein [Candidatus Dormibacteraeota bacterium]